MDGFVLQGSFGGGGTRKGVMLRISIKLPNQLSREPWSE